MLNVLVAKRLRTLVSLSVVIAIWKAQSSLKYSRDYFGAILEILSRAGTERGVHAHRMQVGDFFLQRPLVVHLRHQIQLSLQWLQSISFYLCFVYASGVIVSHLLLVTALGCAGIFCC